MKVRSVTVATKSSAAGGGGAGMYVTDGQRHAFVTPSRLVLRASRDAKPATFALERPTKNGEAVEIIALAMASDGNAIWAVLSDTFALAQGRFVARLTWSGTTAAWGPLKSPYPWSPYSHAGMFLERIGAVTVDTAFVAAYSESSSLVRRVGKRADKGVPIARGHVAFGVAPPSLLVFADRKFRFYDAAGTVVATFGFSGAVKQAVGTPAAVRMLTVLGRDVTIVTARSEYVTLRLDADPPALVVPGGPAQKLKPTSMKEATGPYGALDPSRSRSPMVIAIERVRAWDLNETPVFSKPAPFGALILQPGAVQFCREHDGRLRKSFDFMAHAVTVSVVAPPKHTPKGIVLAQLRTPSGLTQVLCRAEFAEILAASTGRKKQ